MGLLDFLKPIPAEPVREHPPVDYDMHDSNIEALSSLSDELRAFPDPITARVLGVYPDRRIRKVRISPRNVEHHD